MPSLLECTDLAKTFNGHPVLHEVNFKTQSGQIVALLGPSGCGKTTTLRLIAGFEWPDSGSISINGRLVADSKTRVPAEQRRVGMVFQEYALFPHLDVTGNIAFGLNGASPNKDKRVADLLSLVGLEGLDQRMPYELSGGQQQRVALARALAPQPDVLLLDEPFSNLDAALRMQVRGEVRSILKQAGITCIFVTHDQEEALSLADAVAVMMDGTIVQYAPPVHLYYRPTTREVASFVGEANFLRGEATNGRANCALGSLPLLEPISGVVDILVRPEAMMLTPAESGSAVITWREFYGHDQRVGLRLDDGTTLVARLGAAPGFSVGQRAQVGVEAPVLAFRSIN